jgi:diguanylate cyclase (GGDEF)-like protein/PAS domain S-box-containing protein
MALVSLDGRLLRLNPAAQALLGRGEPPDDSLRFDDLFEPDRLVAAGAAFARAAAGEAVEFEAALRHARGFRVELTASLIPALVDGTLVGVYLTGKDPRSSERHRASRNARFEELSALFRHHPSAVLALDVQGRCMLVNPACERLTGYRAEELIGLPYRLLVAPQALANAEALVARVLRGEAVSDSTSILCRDGRRVDFAGLAVPIVVGGTTIGLYAIGHDVTEERRLESEVAEQSERIRQLYLVASSVGRTPEQQIAEALELGRSRLGCNWGYVTRIEGGIVTFVHSLGEAIYPPGYSRPLDRALRRLVTGMSPPASGSRRTLGPVAFIAAPVVVGGQRFGTLGFLRTQRRLAPFTASDRDFVRLIGALVASMMERGEQRRRLDALAFFDALTGLPNRVLLRDRLTQTGAAAQRTGRPFAVHFVDLDDFKRINDRHGHAGGDEVLQLVAHRLERAANEGETVGRFGGDEFVVIQPNADAVDAACLAERLRTAVGEPFSLDGREHQLTASVGVAVFPEDGNDATALLSRADAAMYRVKTHGRNGTALFNPAPLP